MQLLLSAAAYAPAPLPALHARSAVHRATLPACVAETAEEEGGGDVLDTVLGVLLPLGAGAAAYALHAPAFSEFAAQWQAAVEADPETWGEVRRPAAVRAALSRNG